MGAALQISQGLRCPRCHGDTCRVRRRPVDLLVSYFVLVHRYRCNTTRCNWEGNVRPPASSHTAFVAPGPSPVAAKTTLFRARARAEITLDCIGDAVISTDLLGNISYLNPVAQTLTGWPGAEAIGRPLLEVMRIVDRASRKPVSNPAERALAANAAVRLPADCVLLHRDGSESSIEDSAAPIHDQRGAVCGVVLVLRDISDAYAMSLRMRHAAEHDFLTGLPNRLLMSERLVQAIGHARRQGKQVSLLFLDLDCFKHINDALGHAIGDKLLQSVAQRISSCVRTTDTVCRQGGDEFLILLAQIDQAQDAMHVAEKLLLAFTAPHLIDGSELHVTLSIGISIFPDDADNDDAMLRNADTAMYHAKTGGRNNFQFFRADMNSRALKRLLIETSLRSALKNHQFVLHYQPQIDLVSGEMSGAEAFIRWRDPPAGFSHPAQFIAVAEQSGLIVPMGRWVLREVCRQIQAWLDAGLPAVAVSVNVSAIEVMHAGFIDGIRQILLETGIAPHYLALEFSESILVHDAESSVPVLQTLKDMGLQLAIDDFGSGNSNLGFLQRFPVDTLKIDRSLVRNITTDADSASIVGAMIGIGMNLKQRVVAEGVETREQLAFLRARHCAHGQGYQFSHPLCADDFGILLARAQSDSSQRRVGLG